jgi:hypothetical protein
MVLTVSAEIQTAAADQSTTQEAAWVAGLRYILADSASFQTWLQAQDSTTRTGYRITKYRPAPEVSSMGVDDKSGIRGRKTDVVIHVRTDELAPS